MKEYIISDHYAKHDSSISDFLVEKDIGQVLDFDMSDLIDTSFLANLQKDGYDGEVHEQKYLNQLIDIDPSIKNYLQTLENHRSLGGQMFEMGLFLGALGNKTEGLLLLNTAKSFLLEEICIYFYLMQNKSLSKDSFSYNIDLIKGLLELLNLMIPLLESDFSLGDFSLQECLYIHKNFIQSGNCTRFRDITNPLYIVSKLEKDKIVQYYHPNSYVYMQSYNYPCITGQTFVLPTPFKQRAKDFQSSYNKYPVTSDEGNSYFHYDDFVIENEKQGFQLIKDVYSFYFNFLKETNFQK